MGKLKWFDIICDNCGEVLEIKAKNMKEALSKSENIDCCGNKGLDIFQIKPTVTKSKKKLKRVM